MEPLPEGLAQKVLAIIVIAAMNIQVQGFFCGYVFISLMYVHRSGIVNKI